MSHANATGSNVSALAMAKNPYSNFDPNSTAQSLLDRGSYLVECGVHENPSTTLMVLTRNIATPIALTAIFDPSRKAGIEAILSDVDFDIETAASMAEVLQHVPKRRRHYVVITDSLELVRLAVAQGPEHLHHVVLIMEGSYSAEAEGYQAGAADCIAFGSHPDALRARLTAARRLQELQASLQAAVVQGREYSVLDELTRVASRRFFARHFPLEIERAQKLAKALSLLVCDIDHFKRINDQYGHPAGDEVLREFTGRLRRGAIPQDGWLARLGGEEFGIVLPDTSYDAARVIALKMRQLVAERPFSDGTRDIPVTASFGVCSVDGIGESIGTLANEMVKAADAALYRSKNEGRNCVMATLLRSSGEL